MPPCSDFYAHYSIEIVSTQGFDGVQEVPVIGTSHIANAPYAVTGALKEKTPPNSGGVFRLFPFPEKALLVICLFCCLC